MGEGMSDTPRADAEAKVSNGVGVEVVASVFAQKIERELFEVTWSRDHHKAVRETYYNIIRDLISENKRLNALLGGRKPQRILLIDLPEAGETNDNMYLTLHDHYMQTKKLRDKIKELERNK